MLSVVNGEGCFIFHASRLTFTLQVLQPKVPAASGLMIVRYALCPMRHAITRA